MLIDSHCHLDFPDFADELDADLTIAEAPNVDLVALDDALNALSALDDRRGRVVDGAAGAGDRQVRGRAVVLHLRHQDAPRRLLLRLRGLRLHQRL